MSISIRPTAGYDLPGTGGGGGGSAVQPPAPTSQNVPANSTPAAKTFGAFTDPGGVIASYASAIIAAQGSPSASGTGLGPYTFTVANGNSFSLLLNARNGSGDTVATAVHAVLVGADGSYTVEFRAFGPNPTSTIQSTYIAFTGTLT